MNLLDKILAEGGVSSPMRSRRSTSGFTAAEMLVATAIAAVVVGAAALAFGTVTRGQRQFTQTANVRLPSRRADQFLQRQRHQHHHLHRAELRQRGPRGIPAREVHRRHHPGHRGLLPVPRQRHVEHHPPRHHSVSRLRHGAGHPEAFRTWLAAAVTGLRHHLHQLPQHSAPRPTSAIFILGYSATATTIPVLAVYDMDLVQATNPNGTGTVIGTYASVRRYVSGALTVLL